MCLPLNISLFKYFVFCIVHAQYSQELTLKLEKLTEERGKKKKLLENEVTSTLTTQVGQIHLYNWPIK